MSQDGTRRLLAVAGSLKARVLLSLGYGSGLRAGEVVRLKVKHIDSVQKIIRVEQSKSRKDRNVMLSPETLDLLRQWWKTRWRGFDSTTPMEERWLFPGQRPGKPMTTRQLNRLFHDAADAAGIRRGVTLHALCHSFATHLLERRGTASNLSAAQQADIQAVIAETFRFAFLSIAAFTTFAFSSRCRSRCAAFRTAPARRGLVGCVDPRKGGDIMPSCTNAHWATSPTPAVRPRARERSRPIRSRAAPALRRGWKPRHISFRVGAEDAPYLEQEFQERFDRLDMTQLPNYRIYLKLMIDVTPSNPFSAVTLRPY